MEQPTAIVWFRRDLRIADNPALLRAVHDKYRILPLFIWDPASEHPWEPGAASQWWLHHSLKRLERKLQGYGSRLIIRAGSSLEELNKIIAETGASAVFWNRLYEPAVIKRDKEIKAALTSRGITVDSFNSLLLAEPWQTMNSSGKPYQVFTPYWRSLRAQYDANRPPAAPLEFALPSSWPGGIVLEDLGLLPRLDWAEGFRETWRPGEDGAWEELKRFDARLLAEYKEHRDRPDLVGTSRLSPHLHFGEISPRQIWWTILELLQKKHTGVTEAEAESYLRQLAWREFAHHLLFHFPHTAEAPLRPQFAAFPWKKNDRHLTLWQEGQTGYPIVDASMRELWRTGWMHNRMRMVVGSFLVKHLLIPWQAGARWFWDTLVDADLANNTLGWQWIAGCGADAAPFFRIFNPVKQAEKFDPRSVYTRRWVPELLHLRDNLVQQPWLASSAELAAAGVVLGETYPERVVEHAKARDRALEAFEKLKRQGTIKAEPQSEKEE